MIPPGEQKILRPPCEYPPAAASRCHGPGLWSTRRWSWRSWQRAISHPKRWERSESWEILGRFLWDRLKMRLIHKIIVGFRQSQNKNLRWAPNLWTFTVMEKTLENDDKSVGIGALYFRQTHMFTEWPKWRVWFMPPLSGPGTFSARAGSSQSRPAGSYLNKQGNSRVHKVFSHPLCWPSGEDSYGTWPTYRNSIYYQTWWLFRAMFNSQSLDLTIHNRVLTAAFDAPVGRMVMFPAMGCYPHVILPAGTQEL